MGKTDKAKRKQKDLSTSRHKARHKGKLSLNNSTSNGSTKPEILSETKTVSKLTSPSISINDKGSNGSKEKSDVCSKDKNIFPSWTPWVVALVTSLFRVVYVIDPDNWWVLHPDEIFQSMEVAHSEVYGYGFRPYEFTRPTTGNNLSHYLLRERTLGMNAMRSPLYPQYFMGVSLLLSVLGIEGNPYLVWRISHVVFSSSLPMAVYYFTMKVHQSHDTASLSAIFVTSSSLLTQVGTHTLVNSFVSPAIFVVLARVCSVVQTAHYKNSSPETVSKKDRRETARMERSVEDSALSTNSQQVRKKKTRILECCQNGKYSVVDNNSLDENITEKDLSESMKEVHSLKLRQKSIDTTSSEEIDSTNQTPSQHSASKQTSKQDTDSSQRHKSSWTSSDLGYFSQQSRSSKGSTSSNSSNGGHVFQDETKSGSYVDDGESTDSGVFDSVGETELSRDQFQNNTTSNTVLENKNFDSDLTNIGTGILLIFCIFVRPDSAILLGLVGVFSLNSPRNALRVFLDRRSWMIELGFVVGALLATANDIYYYNCLVVSPFNWFKFNVLSNETSKLFGTSDASFYLTEVFFKTWSVAAMFVFCIGHVVTFIGLKTFYGIRYILFKISNNDMKSSSEKILSPPTQTHVLGLIIMVAMYSSFGHKEPRFLHDGLVLFFIIISDLVHKCCKQFQSSKLCKTILFILLAVLLSIEISDFRTSDKALVQKWPFTASQKGKDANQCLYFVSQRDDVTGVYLDRNFHSTGSFSLLHKQVPVFFRLQNEFLEFDSTSLISLNRSCLLNSNQCTVQYYSLHSVSDLIHSSNSEYLIKRLLTSSAYNYAIVLSEQDFFSPAYHVVFKTRTATVWRRGKDKESRRLLSEKLARIPNSTSNATVLEYEGEVLKQLGHYSTALSRFSATLNQGHDKASVYASMAYCFYKMGREKDMKDILRKCYRKFEKSSCQGGDHPRVVNKLWS